MLRADRERGSVALVVMVMFIMASLAAIMVSRTMADGRVVVGDGDRLVALDAADQGTAVALARVSGGETADFSDAGSSGAARWTTTVHPISSTEWSVTATGSVSGVTRDVDARIVLDDDKVWHLRQWSETAVP